MLLLFLMQCLIALVLLFTSGLMNPGSTEPWLVQFMISTPALFIHVFGSVESDSCELESLQHSIDCARTAKWHSAGRCSQMIKHDGALELAKFTITNNGKNHCCCNYGEFRLSREAQNNWFGIALIPRIVKDIPEEFNSMIELLK